MCSAYHNSLHVNAVIMNKTSPPEGTSLVSPHSIDANTVLSFSHEFLLKMLSQCSTGT